MNQSQLERLDGIAEAARNGNFELVGVLSTGERLYVALASGKMQEVAADYTIVEALARLGEDDVRDLIERWRYKG